MIELADVAATEALGAALARACEPGMLILLRGELGTGKTTLTRGWLRALAHAGAVKSPTYTLVETYQLPSGVVHHFDLYRLADAEELEFMGLRDYLGGEAICLVEWPERGGALLADYDIAVTLDYAGERRRAGLSAGSARGATCLARAGLASR